MDEKRPGEALHIVRLLYRNVTADEYRALREHFDQPSVHERLGGTATLYGYVGELDIELLTTTKHVHSYPEAVLRSEIAFALFKLRSPAADDLTDSEDCELTLAVATNN